MDWRVPLPTVTLGAEEAEAARRVIASGWLTMGEEVAAFEAENARLREENAGLRAVLHSSTAPAAAGDEHDSRRSNRGDSHSAWTKKWGEVS